MVMNRGTLLDYQVFLDSPVDLALSRYFQQEPGSPQILPLKASTSTSLRADAMPFVPSQLNAKAPSLQKNQASKEIASPNSSNKPTDKQVFSVSNPKKLSIHSLSDGASSLRESPDQVSSPVSPSSSSTSSSRHDVFLLSSNASPTRDGVTPLTSSTSPFRYEKSDENGERREDSLISGSPKKSDSNGPSKERRPGGAPDQSEAKNKPGSISVDSVKEKVRQPTAAMKDSQSSDQTEKLKTVKQESEHDVLEDPVGTGSPAVSEKEISEQDTLVAPENENTEHGMRAAGSHLQAYKNALLKKLLVSKIAAKQEQDTISNIILKKEQDAILEIGHAKEREEKKIVNQTSPSKKTRKPIGPGAFSPISNPSFDDQTRESYVSVLRKNHKESSNQPRSSQTEQIRTDGHATVGNDRISETDANVVNIGSTDPEDQATVKTSQNNSN